MFIRRRHPPAGIRIPHRHIENRAVCTGTHDHNTMVGWFSAEPGTRTIQTAGQVARERSHALKYTCSGGCEIHWDFIRMAHGSVARLAIFPLQDVLGWGPKRALPLEINPRSMGLRPAETDSRKGIIWALPH